ncbi:MAG TPA: nucleoside monophosphate kinase [Candidatus Woesearchaeota archaeon]|nr:nucleoside monophosphate kinase [Candidatus Woesearchaeota archaeon]
MKLAIFGPPGSGKGTQAKKIAGRFSLRHISTGDIIRENIASNTKLGKKFKEYNDKGLLVPDEWVFEALRPTLPKEKFILDGFPRTIGQARMLDTLATLDMAIMLKVSDEEVLERISGRRVCSSCGKIFHIKFRPPEKQGFCDACGSSLVQRKDDTEEIVKSRLSEYHSQTKPILEFYEDKKILYYVDGEKSIEEVFSAVCFFIENSISK